MNYKTYKYEDKGNVMKLLDSHEHNAIIAALIGAVNGIDDWEWLQDLCLKYILHENYWVAKTAISSIGDITRIHGFINKEKIENEFKKIDKEKYGDIISNTLDDVNIFLGNNR